MNKIAVTFFLAAAIAVVLDQTDIGRMSSSTTWALVILLALGGGIALLAKRLSARARDR